MIKSEKNVVGNFALVHFSGLRFGMGGLWWLEYGWGWLIG